MRIKFFFKLYFQFQEHNIIIIINPDAEFVVVPALLLRACFTNTVVKVRVLYSFS